jgi:VanZ family protein
MKNKIMYEQIEKHKVLFIYVPLALYWILLVTATSLPGQDVPDMHISDKIEHFAAYGGLAVLLSFTYSFQKKIKILAEYPFLLTIFTISLYGMLDELHQKFIPGRSCDVKDWIADTTGALLGILIVFSIKKIHEHFSKKKDPVL